tara:strand:+ start:331 stop:873 length:543 start_codon:yes stop_codon:yes gene_type:complete
LIESLPAYWKWDDAVSPAMCDILLEERNTLQEIQGYVGDANATVLSVRNSKICWARKNHWVEAVMYNHCLYANELTGWGFQVGRPEAVQLAAYDIDGFYGWHEDWMPLTKTTHVRKLSAVLLLSNPEEFEGGQFQFKDDPVEMKRGTLIVFPSFITHQVTPVTKGIRYSATCWVQGPKTF